MIILVRHERGRRHHDGLDAPPGKPELHPPVVEEVEFEVATTPQVHPVPLLIAEGLVAPPADDWGRGEDGRLVSSGGPVGLVLADRGL
jgi:hypothetical protein